MINGGDEASQIADHPAAERDGERRSIEPCLDHAAAELLGTLHCFGRFPGWDGHEGWSKPGLGQSSDNAISVKSRDVLIRNQRARGAFEFRRDNSPDLAEKARADQDFVISPRRLHVD